MNGRIYKWPKEQVFITDSVSVRSEDAEKLRLNQTQSPSSSDRPARLPDNNLNLWKHQACHLAKGYPLSLPGFISIAIPTVASFFIEIISLNNKVTKKTLKMLFQTSAATFKHFGHQIIRNNYCAPRPSVRPPRPRGYAPSASVRPLLQLSRKRA